MLRSNQAKQTPAAVVVAVIAVRNDNAAVRLPAHDPAVSHGTFDQTFD